MKLTAAIGGGIAGAVVLTAIHETLRRLDKNAPRMDLLGMEALANTLDKADVQVPKEDNLFKLTMAGDLISNSLYYSIAGLGDKENAVIRVALLGLAAGVGAVYLPEPIGLNKAPSNRTLQTKLMTVALYSTGGITAGVTSKFIEDKT